MTDSASSADVVVVGGGIVGAFTAYYLAKAGAAPLIIDERPGEGASAGNAGVLALSYSMPMSNPTVLISGAKSLFGSEPAVTLSRPMSMRTVGWLAKFALASRPGRATRDAPKVYELATSSLALYDDFAREENVDLKLRRTGWLYVARSPKILDAQIVAAKELAAFGVRHTLLNESDLRATEPGIGPGHIGGLHFTNDVSMDPGALTSAVLAKAVEHGATLLEERVVSVDRSGSRVHAVRTSSGKNITAGQFVIAAGGDSTDVAKMFGSRLAVERGFGWSLVLPTDGPVARQALMGADEHVVINPGTTSVRITGGMEFGGPADAVPPPHRVDRLRVHAEDVLPALRRISDRGVSWRGARPMTPSGVPFTGHLADNLIAVTGHGTLGMTLAPASARQAAALTTNSPHN